MRRFVRGRSWAGVVATALAVLAGVGWALQVSCGGAALHQDAEIDAGGESLADPADGGHIRRDATEDTPDQPEVAVSATCGDGVVDFGEECDDGNRLDGDACDWACRPGPGEAPTDDPLEEIADADTLSMVVTSADIDLGGMRPASAIAADRQPLVWNGSHYATVALIQDWDEAPTTSSDLQFVKFERDGTPAGPGWRLHEPGRPFGNTDLVWNGEGFGLAWTNWRDSRIWFVELDADGKPIFSPAAVVEGVTARRVSLVWNDGTYGAFWVEGAEPVTDESREAVGFVPFDRRGLRSLEPVEVFRSEELTVVGQLDSASSGGTAAVAYSAGAPSPSGSDEYVVFVAAVTSAGAPLAGPMRIGPSTPVVAIGWDQRSAFGLVWVRWHFDPPLHLARMDARGVLLGPPRPVGRPVSWPSDPLSQIAPTDVSIAFGAGGWGIAFPQAPSNPTCGRRAGLVRTDRVGTLTDLACLDAVLVTTQAFSDVAFDGEAFGWLHNRHEGLRLIRWLVGP